DQKVDGLTKGQEALVKGQGELAQQIQSGDTIAREQYEEIRGFLKGIDGRVVDMYLLIEDLPAHLQKSEQTGEFVVNRVENINQKTEEQHQMLTTMTGGQTNVVEDGSRGTAQLHGSGLFSHFIRPEFEKFGRQQDALEQKLEQLEQHVSKASERSQSISGGDLASSVAM